LPKETEEVKHFLKRPEVKKVFDAYDKELKMFFDFYCKCELKRIGFRYEDEIKWMDYWEVAWFAYQTNIVPTIISVDDMKYIFLWMLRELEVEQPENAELKSFDYEFFKWMLVRIAALGQFKLGG